MTHHLYQLARSMIANTPIESSDMNALLKTILTFIAYCVAV